MRSILLMGLFLAGCSSGPSPYKNEGLKALDKAATSAFERKDYQTSTLLYHRLWQSDENNLEFGLSYAKSLMKLGRVDDAKNVYQRLLPVDQDMKVRKGLAVCYLIKGEFKPAITLYEEILAKYPDDADVQSCLGMAYDLKGDHAKAQEHHKRALELDPHNVSYQNNWGLSLAFSGHPEEALSYLEPLGKSPAATPKQRHNLAIVYALLGEDSKARTLLAKDLSPTQVESNMVILKRFRDIMKKLDMNDASLGNDGAALSTDKRKINARK